METNQRDRLDWRKPVFWAYWMDLKDKNRKMWINKFKLEMRRINNLLENKVKWNWNFYKRELRHLLISIRASSWRIKASLLIEKRARCLQARFVEGIAGDSFSEASNRVPRKD